MNPDYAIIWNQDKGFSAADPNGGSAPYQNIESQNLNNGLYGTTSGPVQQQTDPYAQYGGQTAYNGLVDSLNTQKANIQGSATDWAKNYGLGYGQNISDFVSGLRTGQQGIDERGVQNELAKKQATQGILGMVSRGIHSGGVMLANRNAADSSAAGALANAYGEIGRQQLSGVGNKYAIENRNIGLAQDQFTQQAQAGANKLRVGEQQDVASAVSQARDKLAALDAWAADRSLPERIAVEQEKANIQAQIDSALGGYNDQLTAGVSSIQPASADQRRSTAAQLANAGTVATNPFDFQSQTPINLQGGPVSSNLPLFLAPSKRKQ